MTNQIILLEIITFNILIIHLKNTNISAFFYLYFIFYIFIF